MIELGTPPKLTDAQMGHGDRSIGALCSHVTDSMVRRLLDGLTTLWIEALNLRRQLHQVRPWLSSIGC